MEEKGNPPKTQYQKDPNASISGAGTPDRITDTGELSLKSEYASVQGSLNEIPVQKRGHFCEGDKIGHNYTVIHRLGEGASGTVYKVRSSLGDIEALKIAPPELLGTLIARQNFIQELKLARTLHHPNLVPVHNVEVIPESEIVFFTMAYMQAGDLNRRLETGEGGLPHQDVLKWMGQVAEALAYVHGKGLVHQDIKPANILLNDERHAFLGDFGLAFKYMSDSAKKRMSRTSRAGGTSYFMSPEQQQAVFFGRKTTITAASDVCAFGLTLYALISGELISGRPELMREFIEDGQLANQLDQFLDCCWARQPEKRFQNGSELLRALKAFSGNSTPVSAQPVSRITESIPQNDAVRLKEKKEQEKERQAVLARQKEERRKILEHKKHQTEQAALLRKCADTSNIPETSLSKLKRKQRRFVKLVKDMDPGTPAMHATGEIERLEQAVKHERARLETLRPMKRRRLFLVCISSIVLILTGLFIAKKIAEYRDEKWMYDYVLEYRSLGSCDRYFEVFGNDGYFFKEITKLRMEAIYNMPLEDWAKWEKAGSSRLFELPGTHVFLKMRWVPAGSFQMKSPEGEINRDHFGKQREVRISKGFWMGETEITQKQWHAVRGNNPSYFKGPDRPVDQVSWNQIQDFLDRVNTSSNGWRFALPTEAQWEYACMAESTGKVSGELDAMAWYEDNSEEMTRDVGLKLPNSWGLFDMYGNVWEWCQDWLGEGPLASLTDPQGMNTVQTRAIRGGSWGENSMGCRAVSRHGIDPDKAGNHIGFRLVFLPISKSK